MLSRYEAARAEQSSIQRTLVQGDARLCSNYFGMAWKGMFPRKTAEELAARTGCSVRAAAYELSGEREPSPQAILVTHQLLLSAFTKSCGVSSRSSGAARSIPER
jgi:hypothetical protein